MFFANGMLTIIMSWAYRTPLAFFWTIPGTVIVGNSLGHLRWSEVLGAYVVTGVLILLVGLSGLARRLMDWIPMPITMAMVAGVFPGFGLGLVDAVWASAAVALPMAIAFLVVGAVPRLARVVPPILAAMVVGIAVLHAKGRHPPGLGMRGGVRRLVPAGLGGRRGLDVPDRTDERPARLLR
ncbi:benzoate/H(+) symporter BenE family transporter [Dietzia maris]